jgi:hypothetical protein
MAREDLIGLLQSAMARGYPLRSAMQSLYNAGYSKFEVEEAARSLEGGYKSAPTLANPPAATIPRSDKNPVIPVTPITNTPETKNIQKISSYGKPAQKSSNFLIYFLVSTLVILILGLVAILVFRDQFVQLVKSITG